MYRVPSVSYVHLEGCQCIGFHGRKCLVSGKAFAKRKCLSGELRCSSTFVQMSDLFCLQMVTLPSVCSSLCWSLFFFWVEIKPSVDLALAVFLLQVFLSLSSPLVFVHNFSSSVMLDEEKKNKTFITFLSVRLQLGFLPLKHPSLLGLLFCPLVLWLNSLSMMDEELFFFFISVAWQNRGTEMNKLKFYIFLGW